jgi:Cof subfamily protein (haloacid dehalogenase superfamily)
MGFLTNPSRTHILVNQFLWKDCNVRKKKIRLIVSDFDGTLKHSGDYISEVNLSALSRFHHSGGHVLIATARPLYGIRKYLACLPFVDYLILCNGGWIWDVRRKKTIFESPLDHKIVSFLSEQFWNSKSFDFMMAGKDRTIINRFSKEKQLADYQRVLRSQVSTSSAIRLSRRKILNIEVSASHRLLQNLSEILSSRFPGQLTAGFSWSDFIEIHSSQTSKGVALSFLAERLGVQMEEILAFGDGDNDIGLFQHAGTSVAMANATSRLREYAQDCTLHYNDDGVAHYLNNYVLSGG